MMHSTLFGWIIASILRPSAAAIRGLISLVRAGTIEFVYRDLCANRIRPQILWLNTVRQMRPMSKIRIFSILASFLLLGVCLAEAGVGTVAKAYADWNFVVVRFERNLEFSVGDFLVIRKGNGSVYYAMVSAVDGDMAVADVHRDSQPSTGDRVLQHFGYHFPTDWVRFKTPNMGRLATASPSPAT